MSKLFLKIASFVLTFLTISQNSNAQAGQNRFPDMKKVNIKAIENFNKALSEGTLQKKKSASSRISNTVYDCKDLPKNIRIPGQFEESQAIAMSWQYVFDSDTTFEFTDIPAGPEVPNGRTACDLAENIQIGAKVIIRIKSATDSMKIKNIMIARGTPLKNYKFYVHPIDSFWDRDSGPISFYYGQQDNIGMIDMDYYTLAAVKDSVGNLITDFETINQAGRVNDDAIPVALGAALNYPVYHTPLNDEGGNIIPDGLGTFWGSDGTRKNNTEIVDGAALGLPGFKLYNNYPLPTQKQYKSLYFNSFRLNNHIEPKVFSCDGGTGHIDIYGKLIDENNFALADYTKAINHTDFKTWTANLKLFQKIKDANGKPITIRLVPMPRIADGSIQTTCETVTASDGVSRESQRTYVNGVFVNKNYIMPIQSDPAKPIPSDVEAIAAFKKAMPGYRILPINVDWMFGFGTGGAIHCITMQIPAENPLFIRHRAITGEQPFKSEYMIDAIIKNKSGLSSQFVYYRKSTSRTWKALKMYRNGFDTYSAPIPSDNFMAGDTIQYFIEAKSKNGKTITKPFVAREGGFNQFVIANDLCDANYDAETNFTLNAYPNPTSGSFILPISVDDNRKVSIEIADMLNNIVYSSKIDLRKGLHLQEINLDKAAGIYIIRTTIDNAVSRIQRLLIK